MKELIDILKIKLQEIEGIQEVFMYRNPQITKYPAIVCNLDSSDNTFQTTADNKREVQFKVFAIINVAGKTMQEVDEVIIPKTFDNLVNYFDANWNFGTNVEGHRIWSVLSLAQSRLDIQDKSKTAFLDCILNVKYTKNN